MADPSNQLTEPERRIAALEADNARLLEENRKLKEDKEDLQRMNRRLLAVLAAEGQRHGLQEPGAIWKGASPYAHG